MSLTIPPRTGAPLAPTSFRAPPAAEPTRALSTRLDNGPGDFKDGYEPSPSGANNRRAHDQADSSFDGEPGRVADLVRASRAARPSGRTRTENIVRDAVLSTDTKPEKAEDFRGGGSNWRKSSREISSMGG